MANILADPRCFLSTKWGFQLLWKPPMKAVQRPHADICSPLPEYPTRKGGGSFTQTHARFVLSYWDSIEEML